MIEITKSILLFKNILPKPLIHKLKQLIVEQETINVFNLDGNFKGTKNRYEVYDSKELYDEFNKFWFDEIELKYQNHFLGYIEDKFSYNKALKHNKSEWKDLFVHLYNKDTVDDNPIHIDFSGISFSCGLSDDYEGGELYFPRQDITYKLNTGDLLLFPGSITHPHLVKTVTDGDRIVLVGQTMGPPQKHKLGVMTVEEGASEEVHEEIIEKTKTLI